MDNCVRHNAIKRTIKDRPITNSHPQVASPVCNFQPRNAMNKENAMSTSRVLHILTTDQLNEGEILARLSDGTTAVFESSELEKLRPRRKEIPLELKIA